MKLLISEKMSARSHSSTDDKPIRSWVMILVFGSIASILTVYHSLLHPDPLSVFYLILISALFTLVVVFIALEISKNKNTLKYLSKTGIFLSIYILLIIWLGINKTIPEYNEITAFKKNRTEILYWHVNKGRAGIRQLSMLYMNATPAISRIEPSVNHWGTKLMMSYLQDQMSRQWDQQQAPYSNETMAFLAGHRPSSDAITSELQDAWMASGEGGRGGEYDHEAWRSWVQDMMNDIGPTYKYGTYKLADDMYELAEALFRYDSKDSARVWYQLAFDYGRTDALERYKEKMTQYN